VPVANESQVIFIKVLAGEHPPYAYDGRPFYRNQPTTRRMPQHLYEQLIIKRGQQNHSWGDMVATGYNLDDLDQEEIYKTVADGIRENRIPASAQSENAIQILQRLDLMVESRLKQAAVVLYAKQEELKYVQCMIKLARFKGTNKLGDFIDNQQMYGNTFQLLKEADAFLRRHLPIASFFKPDQFQRIDKPALPVMAVREALINALCHRDYADRSTDISVAIFDDRLEIWNSGSLPPKITVKDLKHAHDSVLRNKLIANTFYVRGYIEKWGTGTNKIVDLCKADGLPTPQFIERTGGLAVILKFAEPIGATAKKTKIKLKTGLTLRQDAILAIIKKYKSVNIQQIMSELKNPPSIRMVTKDLNLIRQKGMLELTGSKRGSLWKLK
jgi:ATP-dependent DNA helicase RecG